MYHKSLYINEVGKVTVREFANSEEENVVIIRKDTTTDKALLPSVIHPSRLLVECQLYLFEHVQVFCDEKYHVQN